MRVAEETRGWASLVLVAAVAGCGAPPPVGDDPAGPGAVPGELGAPSGCAIPDDAEPATVAALEAVNRLRRQAGQSCLAMSAAINTAAARHCRYFASNSGRCVAKPHRELAACAGFSGETFDDRLMAATYGGRPGFEVMAYVGRGDLALEHWLGSIWHRLPLLSPRVDEAGYGGARGCDTMVFGASGRALEMTTAFYPLARQVGVPTFFDGRTESPAPPAPPDGWPSGYPITVWAPGARFTEHALTIDGTGAPVEHMWLTPGDARAMGILGDELVIYAYRPLARQTTYRVRLEGTSAGAPVHLEWTFTTR